MLHVSCKVVLACGDPEILFSRGGEGSEEYPGLAYRAIYWKQLGPNGYKKEVKANFLNFIILRRVFGNIKIYLFKVYMQT